MSLQIGLYGSRDPQLIESIQEVCLFLGAELVLLDAVPTIDAPKQVQVLIWYMGHIPLTLPAEQHQSLNIYLLFERGRHKDRVYSSSIDPSVFYAHYLVIPFDPEEFAMRIIDGSLRRGYRLDYRLNDYLQAFAAKMESRNRK
ncbi:hypothetical protein [Herpetosiphon llansteffanensis]|uniref:hypothetical protein n=1 Tax=Herpetosiphon llansteffanensis TaxID=2094568 RepID=UPI000D7BE713|nr:hypothetical protein [Herpetosiphon llansteffanensis]